jgi:hypothetical protein
MNDKGEQVMSKSVVKRLAAQRNDVAQPAGVEGAPERIRVVVRAATSDDWIGVAYQKDYAGDPSTIHEYVRAATPTNLAERARRALDTIPDTWLDPLLSGPEAILPEGAYYSSQAVQRLLQAVKERAAAIIAAEFAGRAGENKSHKGIDGAG